MFTKYAHNLFVNLYNEHYRERYEQGNTHTFYIVFIPVDVARMQPII